MNPIHLKKYGFSLFLICTSLFFISNKMQAQKNNINLSFSNTKLEGLWSEKGFYWFEDEKLINLQMEYDHHIFDYLGLGGYVGLGLCDDWQYEIDSVSASFESVGMASSLHYGLKSKLYLIPLIFRTNIPRFDLYITGRTGIISLFSKQGNDHIPKKGHYFDYSIMGGGSLYLSKKLGLFAEAGYKNFEYRKGFNARYGLTYRF